MITKKMMEQAIDQSHDACEKIKDGCIHAHAFTLAIPKVEEDIVSMIVRHIKENNRRGDVIGMLADASDFSGLGPLLEKIYFVGIHTGYRLREIVSEEETEGRFDKKT